MRNLLITALVATLVIIGLSACKSTTTATGETTLSAEHTAALLTPPTDITLPEDTPFKETLLTHTLSAKWYSDGHGGSFRIRVDEIAGTMAVEISDSGHRPYEYTAFFENNRLVVPYYGTLIIYQENGAIKGLWDHGRTTEMDFTTTKRRDLSATIYDDNPSKIRVFEPELPPVNITTKEEFKRYLVRNSTFSGVWKRTTNENYPSEERLTVHFVANDDGSLSIVGNSEAEVQVIEVGSRFFATYKTKSGGAVLLELQNNGKLKGIFRKSTHDSDTGKNVGLIASYWELIPDYY